MKKARLFCVFFGILFLIVSTSPSWPQDSKPKHAPNTLPGVEPEMLTPEYWTALHDNPDEVIMTPAEIERLNEKVRNKRVVFEDYYGKPDPLEKWFVTWMNKGLVMNPLLPLDLPGTIPGDSIRVRLKTNIKHDSTGYVVKMPFRRPDGSLGIANGYIKPDADVHPGYFPYTRRNVLTQIFKLLNQPYGFEDQDDKRDCCGTMLVLLKCFGITTGRVPQFILNAADHKLYMNPSLSTEEKMEELAKLEPVITMAGNSGHIVLYLGEAKNGMQYFMHQAGWGYKDENGDHLIVNRTTINAVTHKWYSINSPNVFTTFMK